MLQVSREQVLSEFDVNVNSRDKLVMLYVKNAFWLNKYVKLLDTMKTQELFDDNIKPQARKGLDKEKLPYLLYMASAKYEILKQIHREKTSQQAERVALKLCREYEGTYSDIFKEVFPYSDNNIFAEYDKVTEFETIKDSLYERKDVFENILLRTQMIEASVNTLNPAIRNWGITNDVNNGSIILVLEPERYILPVSVHVPKYIYTDAISAFEVKKYAFPELDVLKRIDKKDTNFSTNVLVRPTEEQIKQIKLQSKQSNEQGKFLKRVLEQVNGRPHSTTQSKKIEIEIGE